MKKGRRLAVAVLAASIMLTSPAGAVESGASPVTTGKVEANVQAFAGDNLNESQKKALDKVRQIIPELKELSVRNVHYNEEERVWGVSLNGTSQNEIPDINNINAHLTFDQKTGELIALDIQNPKWASEDVPSQAMAREKADEFACQILGDKMEDYQSDNIGYTGEGTQDDKGNKIIRASASVQFTRLVNGIPLLNSGFQVSVDAAGHVTRFHRVDNEDLDLTRFPDLSRAVAKETAEKIYAGLVEMKLNYQAHRPVKQLTLGKDKKETRPVLMYSPSFQGPIDALTGALLADFRDNLPQTDRITLIGEGKKLIASTPEEATRLLVDVFGVDMAGMKFARAEIREELFDPGIKVKEYVWKNESDRGSGVKPVESMRYAHLSTIADTGQLVGFNFQDDSRAGGKGIVSRETAQKTAVQFLQKYLTVGGAQFEILAHSINEDRVPEWVDKDKLGTNYSQPPQFYFNFNPTHQDIPVADRSYYVTVDALSGKIVGFHDGSGSPTVTLPDSKGIVSADTAKAEFLKQHPLRLTYIWPEYHNQKAPAPYLVYLPDSRSGWEYIDAFSGKMVALER